MLALNQNEIQLLEKIEVYLDRYYPDKYALVKERFKYLEGLAAAVSRYPSVKSSEILQGNRRDEKMLINSLSNFTPASHFLHIPTRVAAIRRFLTAKFHVFSLIYPLVKDREPFYESLRSVLFSIVCRLMAEEVYCSCLEDLSFPSEMRVNVARDLINLWESGRDPREEYHLHALENLWIVRDRTPPGFGTMEGNSEVVRLSMDMDERWDHFLSLESVYEETQWSLEEFIFGLSYEEITMIRAWLRRLGISAVGTEEIRLYLTRSAYGLVENTDKDPRLIYNFFIERRDMAHFRKRIAAPGPKKTLEELYLKYIISLDPPGP
jgi:hypothetical protein